MTLEDLSMSIENLSISMEKSIENLAVMVATSFEEMAKRMATKEELAKGLSEVKYMIVQVDRKVEVLGRNLNNYIELSDRRFSELKLQAQSA